MNPTVAHGSISATSHWCFLFGLMEPKPLIIMTGLIGL